MPLKNTTKKKTNKSGNLSPNKRNTAKKTFHAKEKNTTIPLDEIHNKVIALASKKRKEQNTNSHPNPQLTSQLKNEAEKAKEFIEKINTKTEGLEILNKFYERGLIRDNPMLAISLKNTEARPLKKGLYILVIFKKHEIRLTLMQGRNEFGNSNFSSEEREIGLREMAAKLRSKISIKNGFTHDESISVIFKEYKKNHTKEFTSDLAWLTQQYKKIAKNGTPSESIKKSITKKISAHSAKKKAAFRKYSEAEKEIKLLEVGELSPRFERWAKANNYKVLPQKKTKSAGKCDAVLARDRIKIVCELKVIEPDNLSDQRTKLRMAIGQLLEYSFWEGKNMYNELWIVLNQEPEKKVKKYILHISNLFKEDLEILLRCYYKEKNGSEFKDLLVEK